MSEASTYWMYENDQGNPEFSSVAPSDGKLYIAVTPDFLRRMPIAVCEAPTGGTDNHNTYYVRGDISSIYATGTGTALTMMMFIASQSSVDGEDAAICFIPSGKLYPLKTISDTGFERAIGEGDIIANKVCFIRYNPITENILLLNPSMDKEASVATLKVFGEASFNTIPRIRKEISAREGKEPDFIYEELVPISALKKLEDRIDKLERRFIIGIGEPQDALEGAEDGAIYLKMGDILT